MNENSNVVVARAVTKVYDSRPVVNEVDLTINRGEIFGLLGANGAGKTTLVECIQGLRQPDGGAIEVLGLNPHSDRQRLAGAVGSQLQNSHLPDRMRVGEALRLFANRSISRSEAEPWGLDSLWSRPFGALSGGQQQRLFMALALVRRPSLVFLDELTQGVDPAARHDIWQLIGSIRDQGSTVVLVTHFADEADALCDRIAVMAGGRVVAQGTPSDLVRNHGGPVTITCTAPGVEMNGLGSAPGVDSATTTDGVVCVRGDARAIAWVGHHLVQHLGTDDLPLDLHVSEPSLEAAVIGILREATQSIAPEI